MRFGQPIPERIQNAPELWLGNLLYYQGFLDLTSSRQVGLALGPISLMNAMEYCLLMGIEGEQAEDFLWIIQRLDQKYLEWGNKKNGKSG